MTFKISALRRKTMPSKFGGTWDIVQIKIDGGQTVYDLNGYNSNYLKNLKVGDSLRGYQTEKKWAGKTGEQVTLVINKITPEYVYDLLMSHKISPPNSESAPAQQVEQPDTQWDAVPVVNTQVVDESETDPGF